MQMLKDTWDRMLLAKISKRTPPEWMHLRAFSFQCMLVDWGGICIGGFNSNTVTTGVRLTMVKATAASMGALLAAYTLWTFDINIHILLAIYFSGLIVGACKWASTKRMIHAGGLSHHFTELTLHIWKFMALAGPLTVTAAFMTATFTGGISMNSKIQHAILVELRVISRLLHDSDLHGSLKHMRGMAEIEMNESDASPKAPKATEK